MIGETWARFARVGEGAVRAVPALRSQLEAWQRIG
jgi:hypothetical protein